MVAHDVGAIRRSLDDDERAVLDRLARTGPQRSSVTLAADLWGDGHALGWITTENALAVLNDRGCVTYRLGPRDLFLQVRATRLGYDVAQVEWHEAHQVGARPRYRDFPAHADGTDFRNHHRDARGGTIERMPLEQHCDVYYEHVAIHLEQLAERWAREEQR